MASIIERLRFSGRYAAETQNECTARKNVERTTAADLLEEAVKALEDGKFAIEATVACLNTWNENRGAPVNTDSIIARFDATLSKIKGAS